MFMANTLLTYAMPLGATSLSTRVGAKALLLCCFLMCSGCFFTKVKRVAFTPPPPHAHLRNRLRRRFYRHRHYWRSI